ncbi:MAG: indole-3-glycerol phosphate synthase TrpC [Nitrospira sp.]|nr:indole-3-glycerol phosphate synthase TrpC [Nitrospira sp.]MBS0164670.1 indole-3-glycerol phosphate synthase TrpC [Nitrospira sp.]
MILDRILEHKKAELRHKQSRTYLADLKAAIRDAPPTLGFAVTLDATKPPVSPSLIAEVKKASPSLGLLREEFAEKFDHLGLARIYREQGASAVSVLTDKDFFQGDLRYLKEIKQAFPIPALNKEFMVGDIQFYEARAHGADAILLIVAALERRQLIDFHALATELGMDSLFETHHERELDTVLEWIPNARMIGINNRDLKTFTTDLNVTFRLAKRIPSDKLIISESGIHKREDVTKLSDAGIHAMLIGESLIRADNTGDKVRELLGTTAHSGQSA